MTPSTMLFEPGPLRLMASTEFPVSGWAPTLEALVAPALDAFRGGDVALAVQQSPIAAGLDDNSEPGEAADLHLAIVENDSQAGAADSSIGSASAAVGVLEGDLAVMNGELADDLLAAATPPPAPPERSEDEPNPYSQEWRELVVEWYVKLLGREPSDDELESHRGNPGGLAGVIATILGSDEYKERQQSPTPTPTPTPSPSPTPAPTPSTPRQYEYYAGYIVGTPARIAAYVDENPNERDSFDRFLAYNPNDFNRAPAGVGAPGWNEFIIRRGL